MKPYESPRIRKKSIRGDSGDSGDSWPVWNRGIRKPLVGGLILSYTNIRLNVDVAKTQKLFSLCNVSSQGNNQIKLTHCDETKKKLLTHRQSELKKT